MTTDLGGLRCYSWDGDWVGNCVCGLTLVFLFGGSALQGDVLMIGDCSNYILILLMDVLVPVRVKFWCLINHIDMK